MTTLKEIARAAGVSTTTVSNVINGNFKRVSRETVTLIQDIIRESGYIPNQAARSLAQRESRFIAIIVQASEGENVFLNPYNAAYVGALTVCLYEKGYYPLVRFTDDYHTVERDLRGWNVAGAIFNGSFNRNLKIIKSLETVPSVFVDCYFELPGANYVSLDDENAGRMAGNYLAGLGHRRIAFLASILQDSEVDQHRLVGLRRALAAWGIPLPEEYVLPSFEAVLSPAVDALLESDRRPTAFFCSSDTLGVHLIRHLSGKGLRVPEDVSVLGFDGLPPAEYCVPPLTTISQDIDQKALAAVTMLMRHIRDKDLSPERVVVGVKLEERESVAPPGAQTE